MFKFNSPDGPVPHDDAGFLRPQAWEEAKEAFGRGSDIAEMLARLEECRLASPRLLLAAAVHAFLSKTEAQRSAIVRNYLDASSTGACKDSMNQPRPPSSRRSSQQ